MHWENYIEVFKMVSFGPYLWNTVWYTAVTVFATTQSSSMVAFAFARLRARGSTVLFALVLSTMMLPPQVVMIPQYLLFISWGGSIRIYHWLCLLLEQVHFLFFC